MQGGRSDPLDNLDVCELPKSCQSIDASTETNSPRPTRARSRSNSLPLPAVKDELSITPALDVALTWLREQTVWVLATPITWLYCNCGVRSFKEKRTQQIEAGVETVIAIQKRCRTPFLDVYFTAWSFCAEEEFYLLVLPLLFWNVDVFYARHLTFVITVGLFVGNLYKDLFELPRPINISNTKMSRKVWSPKSVTAIDTTACKDYGFPSTHSMNAVSNSLFTVMYLYLGSGTFAWGPTTTFPFVLAMACAMIWMVSLIVGRLYLGVHSPTDVRGGILLGLVIACGGHLLSGPLDLYIKTAQVEFDDKIAQSVATHLAPLATAMGSSVITVLFLVIILVLHPQVRVSLSLSLCVCVYVCVCVCVASVRRFGSARDCNRAHSPFASPLLPLSSLHAAAPANPDVSAQLAPRGADLGHCARLARLPQARVERPHRARGGRRRRCRPCWEQRLRAAHRELVVTRHRSHRGGLRLPPFAATALQDGDAHMLQSVRDQRAEGGGEGAGKG